MPYFNDKNEADEAGKTALHIACQMGNIGCVFRLVEGGASLVAQDHEVWCSQFSSFGLMRCCIGQPSASHQCDSRVY
jgi:hypothetical protein